MEFYKGHIIDDEGKRWALSCPWFEGAGQNPIPLAFQISQEARKEAWKHQPLTVHTPAPKGESWEQWVERKREIRRGPPERRAKNAAALAALKERHAGQKYNRKLKCWVTVEVTNGTTETEASKA